MNNKEHIANPKESDSDEKVFDLSLRPKNLSEYIGQEKVKDSLNIFIKAAQGRGEAIEHVLIYGPPGLGKTTLANVIANEMGVGIRTTSGPAIERSGDLASILTNLSDRDILFIDEIHRLNKVVEEVLYPAMEDYSLDLVVGKGPSAKTLRLDLPKFTLIGATTRVSLISSPMRDRFGLMHHLDFYSPREIEKIITRSAKILSVPLNKKAVSEIAQRSRFTPRIANRLLRRIRDYSQVRNKGIVSYDSTKKALDLLEIDNRGLDRMDRKILSIIIEKFSGGPVGLETLSAASRVENETICDVYEPFLIQLGFLERTSRGRKATKLAYEHLGHNSKTQRLL